MAMRVGFVPDSEEKVMEFVDGLKLSIKRKINVEKMWSLEEVYHLALRIEEGQLKIMHGSKQQDEKENENFPNVVAVNVDCTSEVNMVKEVDKGTIYEVHVVNNMLGRVLQQRTATKRLW